MQKIMSVQFKKAMNMWKQKEVMIKIKNKYKNAQESWKEMFNRGNFVAVKHEGGNGQLPY